MYFKYYLETLQVIRNKFELLRFYYTYKVSCENVPIAISPEIMEIYYYDIFINGEAWVFKLGRRWKKNYFCMNIP